MINRRICWFSTHILMGILIYKSFGVKVLMTAHILLSTGVVKKDELREAFGFLTILASFLQTNASIVPSNISPAVRIGINYC
jgi:hypothetical protein